MDVEPDRSSARDDQDNLRCLLLNVVRTSGLPEPAADLTSLPHPAAVEAVHRAKREGGPAHTAEMVRRLLRDPAAEPLAPVDPEGNPHLVRSLSRVLAQLPARTTADGAPVTASLGTWSAADWTILADGLRLLDTVWPQMLGELRTVVAQVALLDGMAVDGYTDFTVHGAVLINRRRLSPTRAGLPGPVRLAEALVHEGTHTRCNVSAVREPLLMPAADERAGPLATPLRADPRPLSGLFQQTVVLARCVLLYKRLAARGTPAVRARHDRLLADLGTAAHTLNAHRAELTGHGRQLLDRSTAVASLGSAAPTP
ncbi:aKG-HExxH-type peptide beta-hydroxylase [Streptomyces zagrosensis]|uniref:HEXXH motif-containing protein n=1 Tax=Streptomyces zagrosensis TaxID=1042984 RepID=A0A7W9QA79_9ACTN|nr:HEXXH motif-containing putative peptide modification protein [Streptomyces zagrosensis]MBB5936424.1 HEXXH motif-containing protein [Streptomyces zagrosensis]